MLINNSTTVTIKIQEYYSTGLQTDLLLLDIYIDSKNLSYLNTRIPIYTVQIKEFQPYPSTIYLSNDHLLNKLSSGVLYIYYTMFITGGAFRSYSLTLP